MSKVKIHDPDRFNLQELLELSSHTMDVVLRRMSPEHKQELLEECDALIISANACVCSVGQQACAPRGASRFPDPYTMLKKYEYLYTVLSGWQTKEDLRIREDELANT